MKKTKKKNERETKIKKALDSTLSYDGKPMNENDRNVLHDIIGKFLDEKNGGKKVE